MALPLYGTDPLADSIYDSIRFQQRMHIVRRAQNLPTTAQFDLAQSQISDNELDEVAREFGASPSVGYGFSDILHGIISREPNKIPVADISYMQSELKRGGYLDPTFESTGVYDAQTHGAFSRMEYDAQQAQLHGKRIGSVPTSQAEQALALFAPTRMWEVVAGTAKGFVEQAPETAENLGLVGGAATGALVGAIAGSAVPVVGTAVGAVAGGVIGGVGGFLADLMGKDADAEEDVWYDPLIPQEYLTEDSKRIWEDVAWVATAASLAGGAGVAAKGIAGAISGVQAGAGLAGGVAEAGGAVAAEGVGTAATTIRGLMAAPEVAQVGPLANLTSKGVGLMSKNLGAALNNFMRTSAVARQFQSPMMDIVKAGYTGMFTAGLGGLTAQGLAGEQVTTIEKSIRETPRLETGVQLPLIGDLADLPGLFLNPTQWLPIPGKLDGFAQGLLGHLGNRDLAWLSEIARAPGDSLPTAMGTVKNALAYNASKVGGETEIAQKLNYARLRLRVGTRLLAEEQLAGVEYADDAAYQLLRSKHVKTFRDKIVAGDQETTAAAFAAVRDNEGAAQAAMLDMIGSRDPGQFQKWLEADDIAHEATAAAREAGWANPLAENEAVGIVPLNSLETAESITDMKTRFDAKLQNLKAATDTGAEGTIAAYRAEYDGMLDELLENQMISVRMAETARPYGAAAPEGRAISQALGERAKGAATRLGDELDPQFVEDLADRGYQAVRTYDDASGFSFAEIDEMGDGVLEKIGDYSKLHRFVDNLGVSFRKVSIDDAAEWRRSLEDAELSEVISRYDMGMTPRQLKGHLRSVVNTVNEAHKYKYLKRTHARDLHAVEIRDTLQDKIPMPEGFEHDVVAALKRGAAMGSDVMRLRNDPMGTLHDLGAAMRVNGLPGFSDFIRTMRQADVDKGILTRDGGLHALKKAALGSVVGAGLTVTQPDADMGDFLRGAAFGGVGAFGLHAMSKSKFGGYGYLPDKLARMATSLRYTLSPTFDIGRWMEANATAGVKYGLGPVFRPEKTLGQIYNRGVEDFSGRMLHGRAAQDFSNELMNRVDGAAARADWHFLDDLDRRLYGEGVLHFRPREFERAYAMKMWDNGLRDIDELRERVANINGYGLSRTALEKSMNFVVFPFSFQKKVLTSVGDALIGGPGRGMVIHEGLRRYHQSSLDEDLHNLVQDHLPALDALSALNSFTFPFGLNAGQFFLSGLVDKRSLVGKVMQSVSAVMVPSGAHGSLANVAGVFGDQISETMAHLNDVRGGDPSIHAFVPVVITGEDINRTSQSGVIDSMMSYIPLIRDMNYYFGTADDLPGGGVIGDTIHSLTNHFNTPYHELQEYTDAIRQYNEDLEPLATTFGYESVDGFLQSDVGAFFKEQKDQYVLELGQKYKTGAELSQSFEGHEQVDALAIQDLRDKGSYRTAEEDQVVRIFDVAETTMLEMQNLGVSATEARGLVQNQVREMAYKFAGDRRFQELWDRFFAYTYGPIVRTA